MSFPLGLGPFLAKTEWFCITTDFSGHHSRAIWDSGQYRNLFTELGGYFGDNNQRIYYESVDDGAYILRVNEGDVITEGMSYGITRAASICSRCCTSPATSKPTVRRAGSLYRQLEPLVLAELVEVEALPARAGVNFHYRCNHVKRSASDEIAVEKDVRSMASGSVPG